MVKQSDYKEPEVQICFSVLLELMTILGGFRENIVIVGGSVPPLLIPETKPKYPGTLDIDIALDFKSISDDSYKTILKTLKEKGYYQKEGDQPFKFYRDVNEMTVEIDLLAGEYGGTGKSRRHQIVQEAIKPLLGNNLVKEGLGKIKAKFEEINFIGPNYVADFLEISNAEERDIVKRETFELVNTLMEKFGIEPFKEI